MYLSAEQVALANQAVLETFEETCITWQAIPHWNTADPAQSRVANDIVDNPGFLDLDLDSVKFQLTLVQTSAPSSDSLVAEAVWFATQLARLVDERVLGALAWAALFNVISFNETSQKVLLDSLIDARARVEDAGYRSPSCLITNTRGLKSLSALTDGYPITETLPDSAHVNSVHRTSLYDFDLNAVKPDGTPTTDNNGNPVDIPMPATGIVMLGRRHRIAHGAAAHASPGEEPVDLAVGVSPSVEIVGEAPDSKIEMSARIRYALRVKDPAALVLLIGTPVVGP